MGDKKRNKPRRLLYNLQQEDPVPLEPFPPILMDACCRVFASCLQLSTPLVVELINTLFGVNHPLDSDVRPPGIPDLSGFQDLSGEEAPADGDGYAFSDYVVDLSLDLIERKRMNTGAWVQSAYEYMIEFQPEHRKDPGLVIAHRAIEKGCCSYEAQTSARVRKICAAVLFVRDVSGTRDLCYGDLLHIILRTELVNLYLYPIKAVLLNKKSIEEIADGLLLLLPFEILSPYEQIRNAPAGQAEKLYQDCFLRILQAATARQQRGALTAEDLTALLEYTRLLAKVAYRDRIPSLQ